MLTAIIFDYNGVLVDDVKWHVKACVQALAEVGVRVDGRKIVSLLGTPTSELIRQIIEENNSNADYLRVTRRKVALVKKWISSKNVFSKETFEVVKELGERFKLAIYTGSLREQLNAPPKQFFELFDIVFTGTDVLKFGLRGKPAPDGLLEIARGFEEKPGNCLYVGDLPVDMRAAKRAGMLAVGKENELCDAITLRKAGADVIIKELKELLEIMF